MASVPVRVCVLPLTTVLLRSELAAPSSRMGSKLEELPLVMAALTEGRLGEGELSLKLL